LKSWKKLEKPVSIEVFEIKPGSHEQRKRKRKPSQMNKFPFLAFAFVLALL
jgi:hypothetical protein